MRYIKYIPYGSKNPRDLTTTSNCETQLWQELEMLRHMHKNGIYGKIVIAPYIDQAKIYYLDANSSNWKSAGLLYYYSFLNLAKAYIVTKRALSASYLKSISIYHGLQSNPQNISKVEDFVVNIHPPTSNNKKNIFALFYEKLTGQRWPFNNSISVTLKDVLGYCSDISHELSNFYSTNHAIQIMQSIYRENITEMWIEINVADSCLNYFINLFGASVGTIKRFSQLNNDDVQIWSHAYNRSKSTFQGTSLIRICQRTYTKANKTAQWLSLCSDAENLLKDFILPIPMSDYMTNDYWQFIPKATINGNDLLWHPLLSNYLFSFMLSTLLRYHPHIFYKDDQNSFICEAWCNQSAISTLRYFLMIFTNPPLRMN